MTLRSNLKLGGKIGGGHFGEVLAATDDVHDEVAVKRLGRIAGESDAAWQTRRAGHLAEGRKLSEAQHANVVKVHSLLEDESSDAVLIVMEMCVGGSLQSPYDQNPMLLRDVRRYITQVTMGLVALHSRGMIHRDIKPGNILLGRRGVAQLGDFGLVSDNIIAGYASAAGYSDHLAPEVLNGGPTSVKTDVWALGMTIYRLLHGAEWYSKLPPPRHVAGKGGFAKSLPWLQHIPQAWRTVVRTMMNDDTRSRYQNGNQLLTAYSKLKTTPPWECRVSSSHVSWTHATKSRRYFVELTESSPQKFDWSARSEPIGSGNRRNFGSGKGVDYATADKQLVALFATKLN
jgi:eukaryotic-like serine/threonine-protein kinase